MVVQLDRVSYAYAGEPAVLNDVSLTLEAGEVCALVGAAAWARPRC